jgi:streptogramin lyase
MNAFQPTAGSLLGGIAINQTGDVWVNTSYDIIHLSPTGVANPLHLNRRPSGYRLVGGIVWRNDNTIWYEEYTVYSCGKFCARVLHFLGETNPSGADLKDVYLSSGGSEGLTPVVGSDGRVWFAEDGRCGSGAAGGTVRAYGSGFSATCYPLGTYLGDSIASGPDKRIYVTELKPYADAWVVAQMSTSGAILHQYPLPGLVRSSEVGSGPSDIGTGPDGNLWIAQPDNTTIARMSPTGIVKQFHLPTASAPQSIVQGNDGNLWFTDSDYYGNKIGRITTTGLITEYPIPTPHAGASGIANCRLFGCATGTHGHIWFVEVLANKVGRLDF